MSTSSQLDRELFEHEAETLHMIFQALPIGVMVADVEGRLLFFNPAAENMLATAGSSATIPEHTEVYGWYLSDQVTIVPPERFPLFRASRGEEVSNELFFVRNPQRPAGCGFS